MYSIVCIRPNIVYDVRVVNWFFYNHGNDRWQVVKWVLQYLGGTSKMCLNYGGGQLVLNGYKDEDMAYGIDSIKFISSYMMTFVGAGSWQIKFTKVCCFISCYSRNDLQQTLDGWLNRILTFKIFLKTFRVTQWKILRKHVGLAHKCLLEFLSEN